MKKWAERIRAKLKYYFDRSYNDNDEVTAKDKGTLAYTEAMFIGWLFNSHALVTKAADVPTGRSHWP